MTQLSIIVPTFNSGATLERCLASIASQTFTDYEVLIQDGGSTDNTIDLVKRFEETHPAVAVKLQQEKDKGIYDAMNKAVARASGEWLYFLGSDDELHDAQVLQRVIESEAARSGNVIYGRIQGMAESRTGANALVSSGGFTLSKLLCQNISHQAIFYKREFAAEVGKYNTKYKICADWDYNMRCWSKSEFAFIDLTVANFCNEGISGIGTPDPVFDADLSRNISEYFKISAVRRWVACSRVHSAYKNDEAHWLRNRNDPRSLAAMTRSILHWPFGKGSRYKIWLHMLLTRLKFIPAKH
jgi:glycosyltransferase involved in cell wall biosynthesis